MAEVQGAPKKPNLIKPGLHARIRIRYDPPANIEPEVMTPAREEDVLKCVYFKKVPLRVGETNLGIRLLILARPRRWVITP